VSQEASTFRCRKCNYLQLSYMDVMILNLLAQDMSNKQIAIRTNRALPTIKNRLSVLFVQFNVRSRSGLVAQAIREGVISFDKIRK